MSVLKINRAFQIEGYTIVIEKRILNGIYGFIWLDIEEDKPTFQNILDIQDTLTQKFNVVKIDLREIVYASKSNRKGETNLTQFL